MERNGTEAGRQDAHCGLRWHPGTGSAGGDGLSSQRVVARRLCRKRLDVFQQPNLGSDDEDALEITLGRQRSSVGFLCHRRIRVGDALHPGEETAVPVGEILTAIISLACRGGEQFRIPRIYSVLSELKGRDVFLFESLLLHHRGGVLLPADRGDAPLADGERHARSDRAGHRDDPSRGGDGDSGAAPVETPFLHLSFAPEHLEEVPREDVQDPVGTSNPLQTTARPRWFVVFPRLFFHYSGLTGPKHLPKSREDFLHVRDRTA